MSKNKEAEQKYPKIKLKLTKKEVEELDLFERGVYDFAYKKGYKQGEFDKQKEWEKKIKELMDKYGCGYEFRDALENLLESEQE